MQLTHLSLFSGIGGLDLAAEWAGIRTIGQCEWAEYPTKVLEKHWPDVQRWKDIRTLTGESFYERTGLRTVDIISGGFPCQPFSVAGKRRGTEDDRYLWPEMVRVIKELRPAWVVGENVAGIVRMALPDILSELGGLGYRTRAFLIPACAVGARHRRYRVAIVGYAEHNGLSSAKVSGSTTEASRGEPEGKETACKPSGTSESGNRTDVAHTESQRQQGNRSSVSVGGQEKSEQESKRPTGRSAEPRLGGVAYGIPDWVDGYWDVEPDIPRIASGIPNRVGRLKCLGNAVVPQQFYQIFKAISEVERGKE